MQNEEEIKFIWMDDISHKASEQKYVKEKLEVKMTTLIQ